MVAKDTFFYIKKTLNCKGIILDLSIPKVMGILNVTNDSFYDGGKYLTEKDIIIRVQQMLLEGCSIIDIGANSTKPGTVALSFNEEAQRLLPVIKIVKKEFPGSILSADTFRATIAEQAVDSGVSIINDVSGGTLDADMFKTIGRLGVPYVLMHMQGTPETMQRNPQYTDIVKEVMDFFIEKTAELKAFGVRDIIIDPGFGFGKSLEHNYQLLNGLTDLNILEYPLLAGVSRKSMINKVIHTSPKTALNGTTVLNTIALFNGASILRVHDVKQAVEAIELVTFSQRHRFLPNSLDDPQ